MSASSPIADIVPEANPHPESPVESLFKALTSLLDRATDEPSTSDERTQIAQQFEQQLMQYAPTFELFSLRMLIFKLHPNHRSA